MQLVPFPLEKNAFNWLDTGNKFGDFVCDKKSSCCKSYKKKGKYCKSCPKK